MLRSAAYDVAARMHFARIAAISGNRTCRLSVSSTTSYVIECEDPGWKPVAQMTTPRGITVEANARPEFHYRGNVTPTGTFTLRNKTGGIRRVIVNINGSIKYSGCYLFMDRFEWGSCGKYSWKFFYRCK